MKAARLQFLVTALVFAPIEAWCLYSAYDTQGEVMQRLLVVLSGVNLTALMIFWWRPRLALGGMLAFFLCLVPYQVILVHRLSRIGAEVKRIVAYERQVRAGGASYSDSLNAYVFKDPSVNRYIYSYTPRENGAEFQVSYFVIDPGITHWYDSKTGWGYYPD